MYLCAVTGVMNLLAFIVCLYFQQWVISGITLLLTIRQAIVLPKWRKKVKQEERMAENEPS
jgi:hypothetical protein